MRTSGRHGYRSLLGKATFPLTLAFGARHVTINLLVGGRLSYSFIYMHTYNPMYGQRHRGCSAIEFILPQPTETGSDEGLLSGCCVRPPASGSGPNRDKGNRGMRAPLGHTGPLTACKLRASYPCSGKHVGSNRRGFAGGYAAAGLCIAHWRIARRGKSGGVTAGIAPCITERVTSPDGAASAHRRTACYVQFNGKGAAVDYCGGAGHPLSTTVFAP
ncbi:hypothetical protein V1519DRAFT_198904 [Lipomyces tetrasporus]